MVSLFIDSGAGLVLSIWFFLADNFITAYEANDLGIVYVVYVALMNAEITV